MAWLFWLIWFVCDFQKYFQTSQRHVHHCSMHKVWYMEILSLFGLENWTEPVNKCKPHGSSDHIRQRSLCGSIVGDKKLHNETNCRFSYGLKSKDTALLELTAGSKTLWVWSFSTGAWAKLHRHPAENWNVQKCDIFFPLSMCLVSTMCF